MKNKIFFFFYFAEKLWVMSGQSSTTSNKKTLYKIADQRTWKLKEKYSVVENC